MGLSGKYIEYGENYCSISELGEFLSDLPSYELRELLCDVCGVSHVVSKEELLREIEKKI